MMQSPWGPPHLPTPKGRPSPKLWPGSLCVPFTPSFSAVPGISPPCSYPQLTTSYEIWGTWLEVQARVPGCLGMASSSATPSCRVSGAVGHSRGQQLLVVAQCHQGHTGLTPNEDLGASMVLHRPGLRTLCWMIGISLEFQPSQTQRDCLHAHHMDYYKNTHLSLSKVPRADSGGHGL